MWLHQHANWPELSWKAETLAAELADVRHRQGRLLGRMEGLGFAGKTRLEITLGTLATDVVKSSAIEGENLNPEEVRSSIAHRLGLDTAGLVAASRDVDGVVEMMLDATQNFSQPLTKERLLNWHLALFPSGRSSMQRIAVGSWRPAEAGPMQVVSGSLGCEKVHFEAPSAERLEEEMAAFLSWFNNPQFHNFRADNPNAGDPVLRAGIAHLWLVTIHPFEDGNGRIARAVSDMALACADGTSERFYSLSSQMEAERKDYYKQLEKQQRSTPDITPWLGWFLGCLGRAIDNGQKALAKTLLKAQLWNKMQGAGKPINQRQQRVMERMLAGDFKGYINTSKYAKLAKCSQDTALRDIQDLRAQGVLLQNPSRGRSTSYRLPDEL